MTPPQSTGPAGRRTDPFRWDPARIARALDDFADPDRPASRRPDAREHGIPRATLGCWLRQPDPGGADPELAAFPRGSAGHAFLRRLVLALLLVFNFRGACGLRLRGLFLRLTGLDRFVAPSRGALHELAGALQAGPAAFADEERPRLARGMAPRDIAVVADEHFHGGDPCLVACEPASNFLLVEQYAPRRGGATWAAAVGQAGAGLPVGVVLLTSDQAKGLLACARDGLRAQHLAELSHGQRDRGQPLAGPLQRHKEAAEEELHKAEGRAQGWRDGAAAAAAAPRPGRPRDYQWRIDLGEAHARRCGQQAQACARRQQQAGDALRGLADDYHPFDGQTGAAVGAEAVGQRPGQRLQALGQVAQQAGLGGEAAEAPARGRRWAQALVAALAWFWAAARAKVEALDLPEEAERSVYRHLLPGLYGRQAAGRARTADDRRHKEELAGRLFQQAWAAGAALGPLSQEERLRVERVAAEVVGLFARSSSCVEGRNGRPALSHHGQCRLSAARLKALTAVHDHVAERADGTTAAERFFGQKPRDVFDWLPERMPGLPRPAAKRPRKATKTTPNAG